MAAELSIPLTAGGGIGWVEGVTYERSPKENFEAMRMLLDLGLDPNAANREGRTALMGAALKGRNDVVRGNRLPVPDDVHDLQLRRRQRRQRLLSPAHRGPLLE